MEVDEELPGLGFLVFDIEIGFGIEHQSLGLAEAGQIQITVNKGKMLGVVCQVFLAKAVFDSLFRSTLRKGRRIGGVADDGDCSRLLQKMFGVL